MLIKCGIVLKRCRKSLASECNAIHIPIVYTSNVQITARKTAKNIKSLCVRHQKGNKITNLVDGNNECAIKKAAQLRETQRECFIAQRTVGKTFTFM